MRSKMSVFLIAGVLSLLLSCASQPIDKGAINPENVPEEDLIELYIARFIVVSAVDNIKVDWQDPLNDEKLLKIPAGDHSFSISFNNGYVYSRFSTTLTYQFEKGNTYFLDYDSKNMGKFHLFLYHNNKAGAEIAAKPNAPGAIFQYVKYIINPTTIEVGNSVKLENEDYILLFKPDLAYTLTDKKTRKTTQGRKGFHMNFLMSEGKAYLLETDITKMSSAQFLKSNYEETAQTILVPIACSETSVTYKYEKPLELKGTEITFTITEIKK